MSERFHAKEKIVEQMSRQGLVEENVTQGSVENVSRQHQRYNYGENNPVEAAYDSIQEKSYYQQQISTDPIVPVENRQIPVTDMDIPEMTSGVEIAEDVVTDEISEFSTFLNRISDLTDSATDSRKQSTGKTADTVDDLVERKIQRMKHERKKRKTQTPDVDEADDDFASDKDSNDKNSDTSYSSKRLKGGGDSTDKKEKPEKRTRLKFEDDKFSESAHYAARKLKRQAADEIEEDMDPEAKDMMHNSRKLINASSYAYNRGHLRSSEQHSNHESNRSGKLKDGSRYFKEAEQQRDTKEKIKKSYQKKINRNRAVAEAQNIRNKQEFIVKTKEGVRRIAAAVKSIAGAVAGGSATVIILLFGGVFLIIFLLAYATGSGGGAYYSGLYESTYNDFSDIEAYFRELETDLEEQIANIEDSDEYSGCDEYIYELGDMGHNAVELMSYIATKYQNFTLEMCKSELKSLFEEKYLLIVEIKEEPRERYAQDAEGNILYDAAGNPVKETFTAKICYITLEVREWDDIMANRLTEEERERYDVYKLSQGGQQVYANPLPLDWKNKISSRFGERIHPITKERTMHNGIDIAVAENTPLYSSTDGVVTISKYSESAGNYIVVTMETGYSIKYMHLNSRDVSVGERVTKGMLIGATGNTGRSTGPHLHVEVRTEDNVPIDPTFIISNGVGITE